MVGSISCHIFSLKVSDWLSCPLTLKKKVHSIEVAFNTGLFSESTRIVSCNCNPNKDIRTPVSTASQPYSNFVYYLEALQNCMMRTVSRFLFGWIGDWQCVQEAFCHKPRRMLYAFSVIGIGVAMISKSKNCSGFQVWLWFSGLRVCRVTGKWWVQYQPFAVGSNPLLNTEKVGYGANLVLAMNQGPLK